MNIITLKKGAAELDLSLRGGAALAWRIQGQDLLYEDQAYRTGDSAVLSGGIPVLAPSCSTGGDFRFEGRDYSLPMHGFVRDRIWTWDGRGAADQAQLSYHHEGDQDFPFPFLLSLRYQLEEASLHIAIRCKNLGEGYLPFQFGLHPYLHRASLFGTELPEISPIQTWVDPFDAKLRYAYTGSADLLQCSSGYFAEGLESGQEVWRLQGPEAQLELRLGPDLRELIFWGPTRDFICAEPWTARPLAHQTGEKLLHLAPGEDWRSSFEMRLIQS